MKVMLNSFHCQNEFLCETMRMKMCFPYSLISMQIKLIFI